MDTQKYCGEQERDELYGKAKYAQNTLAGMEDCP